MQIVYNRRPEQDVAEPNRMAGASAGRDTDNGDPATCHSLRNATFGSTRAARNAGMRLASIADASSTAITKANTSGSVAFTLNSSGATHLPAYSATPPPMTTPITVSLN